MTTSTGTHETYRPTELATYHKNPRVGDVDAIAASLRANSQYRPIVVNRGTHTDRPLEVLAGNHTLMAFRDNAEQFPSDERWTSIDCWVIDVDDDRARRIVAADNRTAELGGFDEKVLFELLQELPDLDGTGYDDSDLDDLSALMQDFEKNTKITDPDQKYGEEDSGMVNRKSLDEKLDNYSNSDSRSIILSYRGDAYVWMVEKLAQLGLDLELNSNADVVRKLVEEAIGEEFVPEATTDDESASAEEASTEEVSV